MAKNPYARFRCGTTAVFGGLIYAGGKALLTVAGLTVKASFHGLCNLREELQTPGTLVRTAMILVVVFADRLVHAQMHENLIVGEGKS